jgi:hypothetical protein
VRALVALALSALFLGWGGQVLAQRQAPAAQEKAAGPARADRWGDGRANRDPREQPAHGAPYNWRQMTYGVVIMLLMLAFVIWLVRRHAGR